MGLVDRIAQDDERGDGHSLAAHRVSAALALYALGAIGNRATARARIIERLGLEAQDEAQLDAVLNHIDGLTANQKLAFHGKIEAANILLQTGDITKAEFRAILGIN